jgi:hypothetical protein
MHTKFYTRNIKRYRHVDDKMYICEDNIKTVLKETRGRFIASAIYNGTSRTTFLRRGEGSKERQIVFQFLCQPYVVCNFLHSSTCIVGSGPHPPKKKYIYIFLYLTLKCVKPALKKRALKVWTVSY